MVVFFFWPENSTVTSTSGSDGHGDIPLQYGMIGKDFGKTNSALKELQTLQDAMIGEDGVDPDEEKFFEVEWG